MQSLHLALIAARSPTLLGTTLPPIPPLVDLEDRFASLVACAPDIPAADSVKRRLAHHNPLGGNLGCDPGLSLVLTHRF